MMRFARATAAALMALSAGLLVAAPAHAAPVITPGPAATAIDISCIPPSTDTLTFTPPLSPVLTPTTVAKTTRYTPCMAPQVPTITSGFLSTTSVFNDMCPMVMNPGTVVQTITWNTGATTTMTLSRTASISGTTLTVNFVGTVTGGLFLGSNVKQTYTASAVQLLACLAGTGVVPSIVSKVNLVIFH